MKKLLLISLFLFITNQVLFAQRTRQASCSNQTSAHWYIMPYIGAGAAWYQYDQNGSVMDQQGNSFEQAESNTMLTYYVGVHALYRFSAINLGLGGEWQAFNGQINNGLVWSDLTLNFIKIYGRIEAPIYSDSFNDFGVYANVGALIPNNAFGDSPTVGMFIDLGLYYNLILNKSSSFFFGLGYQQAGFNSTISQAVSKHNQNDVRLTFGYRMWF